MLPRLSGKGAFHWRREGVCVASGIGVKKRIPLEGLPEWGITLGGWIGGGVVWGS